MCPCGLTLPLLLFGRVPSPSSAHFFRTQLPKFGHPSLYHPAVVSTTAPAPSSSSYAVSSSPCPSVVNVLTYADTQPSCVSLYGPTVADLCDRSLFVLFRLRWRRSMLFLKSVPCLFLWCLWSLWCHMACFGCRRCIQRLLAASPGPLGLLRTPRTSCDPWHPSATRWVEGMREGVSFCG